MVSLMNLACSYLVVLLAALLYNTKSQSQVLVAWTLGLLILAGFVVFFLVYGFKEPEWLAVIGKDNSKDKSKRLLGNLGKFFEFFFDDDALMLQTLGVKLYEAIRLIDYIFMLVMLQTHPYWKGLFLSRIRLLCWATLGCFIAFVLSEIVMTKVITVRNAGPVLRITALVSIVLYPLLNTLIANVGFRKPG